MAAAGNEPAKNEKNAASAYRKSVVQYWHMAGGEDQPPKGQDDQEGSWAYHTDNAPADNGALQGSAPLADDHETEVEWTASEFIAHDKTPMWYVAVAVIGALVAALIYIITRDIISVVAVVILLGVFITAAARKPRIVSYSVDRGGITVGRQFHPYGNFKSFAVVDEDAFASITLLPMKRFALPLSLYFSPEDEHRILDVLSAHLPLEQGELDSLDRFMRNIHF
jgi:hypothetical protein